MNDGQINSMQTRKRYRVEIQMSGIEMMVLIRVNDFYWVASQFAGTLLIKLTEFFSFSYKITTLSCRIEVHEAKFVWDQVTLFVFLYVKLELNFFVFLYWNQVDVNLVKSIYRNACVFISIQHQENNNKQ